MNINEALDRVKNSIYGRDIRQAIIDSIMTVYTDAAEAGNTDMEVVMARGTYDTLSAHLEAMNDLIINLGDGSPREVFTTLTALQNAYPTGASGIYLVTSDGNWYFWSGTAWTAGGVYQSTGITGGSLTGDKFKLPWATLVDFQKITVDLKLKTVTIGSPAYCFRDNQLVTLPAKTIDISAFTTGTQICFYDYAANDVKYQDYTATLPTNISALFFVFSGNVYGPNARLVKLVNVSGAEVPIAMNDGTLQGSKLVDGTVSTSKYADGSLTIEKLKLDKQPVLVMEGEITVDYTNMKITIPKCGVAERGYGYTTAYASTYGLSTIEFTFTNNFDLQTIYFDYTAFRAGTNPFKMVSAANFPTYNPKDIVIIQVLSGTVKSPYKYKFLGKSIVDRGAVNFLNSDETDTDFSLFQKTWITPAEPIEVDYFNGTVRMPRKLIINRSDNSYSRFDITDSANPFYGVVTEADLTFTIPVDTLTLNHIYFDYQKYKAGQNPYVKLGGAVRPPRRLHDTLIGSGYNKQFHTTFPINEKGSRKGKKIVFGGSVNSYLDWDFNNKKLICDVQQVVTDAGNTGLSRQDIDLTKIIWDSNGAAQNILFYLHFDFNTNKFIVTAYGNGFTSPDGTLYPDTAKFANQIAANNMTLMATWWGTDPESIRLVNMMPYKVNNIYYGGTKRISTPYITPYGPIKVDKVANKVTLPSMFVNSPSGGWKEARPSDFNLTAWQFDFSAGFVLKTIVLDESILRSELARTTDPTQRVSPIRLLDSAALPKPNEIVLFSSVNGGWYSPWARVDDGSSIVGQAPYYTLYGNNKITVNRGTNKVTIPDFMVESGLGGWAWAKASDFNLTAWQFDLSTGYSLYTVTFNESLLRSELARTTDPTQRVSPFKVYTAAVKPSDPTKEVVFFSSSDGHPNSQLFPIYDDGDTTGGLIFNRDIYKLLLPAKVFKVKGEPLPFYKKSLISKGGNLSHIQLAMAYEHKTKRVPMREYFYEDYWLDEDKLPSSLTVRMKNFDSKNIWHKSIIELVVKDAATVVNRSPKIAMIGDSLTQGDMPNYVMQRLQQMGFTPQMIGSMANSGGTYNEGRGSWTYQNYIGKDNIVTNTVIKRSESGITTWGDNPFLKLATAQDLIDHPDYCFRNTGADQEFSYTTDTDKTGNFYIFDYAWYLTVHNVQTPDVVTIALSTNDLNQYAESVALDWGVKAMQFMVSQIKKAVPNVAIGIFTPAWGSNVNGDAAWEGKVQRWIEQSILSVNTLKQTYSNIEVPPLWAHMDRDFDPYETSHSDLSATNLSQEVVQNEYIHYQDEGKKSYSNAASQFIVNMLT